MSELTREYLDKQLDSQTKEIKSYVNDRISSVEENLNIKIETEIAELARMTNNGFEEIKRELDVRKEVASLDRRTFRIEQALNIKN